MDDLRKRHESDRALTETRIANLSKPRLGMKPPPAAELAKRAEAMREELRVRHAEQVAAMTAWLEAHPTPTAAPAPAPSAAPVEAAGGAGEDSDADDAPAGSGGGGGGGDGGKGRKKTKAERRIVSACVVVLWCLLPPAHARMHVHTAPAGEEEIGSRGGGGSSGSRARRVAP